jgi:hypothetical protein
MIIISFFCELASKSDVYTPPRLFSTPISFSHMPYFSFKRCNFRASYRYLLFALNLSCSPETILQKYGSGQIYLRDTQYSPRCRSIAPAFISSHYLHRDKIETSSIFFRNLFLFAFTLKNFDKRHQDRYPSLQIIS